jgi:RNase P subunit RPR2
MSKKEKTLEKIKELISKRESRSNKTAKRLAMKNNIKLGKLRREFCQKCYSPLDEAKRRIKKGYINVECGKCGSKIRWKVKIN